MQMVDTLVTDLQNAIGWLDTHYIFTGGWLGLGRCLRGCQQAGRMGGA